MNQRAKTYRKLHDIPADWGTAVNIQAMVFGNMGEDCATGVAFTRDPSTGENIFYGEYLSNAQGEDVVAGIRTPQHLTISGKNQINSQGISMEESMPEVFKKLLDIRNILELHYKDMQDIEFTIENGRLYGIIHDGDWFHVGTPIGLNQAEAFFQERFPGLRHR